MKDTLLSLVALTEQYNEIRREQYQTSQKDAIWAQIHRVIAQAKQEARDHVPPPTLPPQEILNTIRRIADNAAQSGKTNRDTEDIAQAAVDYEAAGHMLSALAILSQLRPLPPVTLTTVREEEER